MNWIRAHRYTALLIAAAVLIVTGGIMGRNSAGTGFETEGARNIPVAYPYYAPPFAESGNAKNARENAQIPAKNAGDRAPIVLRFGNAEPKENPPVQAPAPVIPAVTTNVPLKTEISSLNDSYLSFFQALSRMLSPVSTRTPEQTALYNYGNALGSVIRDFETTHTGVVQTLKIFFNSRTDPSPAAGIPEVAEVYARLTAESRAFPAVSAAQAGANLQLAANDYAQLSAAVTGLQHIPPETADLNAKLAKGYANVAEGFLRLIQSENDARLLEGINAYNANADEFIKNYVALVRLFSAYGVKFSANDAGAIFSFSFTGGL